MVALDVKKWMLLSIISMICVLLTITEGIPMNSKAAGWMNDSDDDERSYSHLRGGNKFSKPFVSQPPRSAYYTTARHSSNRTLAAILLLTVFGLAATALLVILCSKVTKKEQYDSMKGAVY